MVGESDARGMVFVHCWELFDAELAGVPWSRFRSRGRNGLGFDRIHPYGVMPIYFPFYAPNARFGAKWLLDLGSNREFYFSSVEW